jgi:hypothetical protein
MNRKGLFLRTGGSAARDVESLAANSSAQLKERHSDDQRVSRKSGNKLHDPISAHCKIKTIQPSTDNLMSLAAIGSPGDEVFPEEIVERPLSIHCGKYILWHLNFCDADISAGTDASL